MTTIYEARYPMLTERELTMSTDDLKRELAALAEIETDDWSPLREESLEEYWYELTSRLRELEEIKPPRSLTIWTARDAKLADTATSSDWWADSEELDNWIIANYGPSSDREDDAYADDETTSLLDDEDHEHRDTQASSDTRL